MSILLKSVRILSTGADGGHIYISGRGCLPGQAQEVDIYAYFNSKLEEQKFEGAFSGQAVVLEPSEVSFTKGVGGEIKIASWAFS